MIEHNESAQELTTIRDFIRWGATRFSQANLFFGHGTANALDESAALVLHALSLPYDLSSEYFSSKVTTDEKIKIIGLLQQRIEQRIPAAYLTREAVFAGLAFYVDERVLVPRSPIAELIEQRFEPWVDPDVTGRVLDLCTGSGCIAIACCLAFPNARVDAVDVSDAALDVASINVEKHQVQDSVHLIKSDLFAQLDGQKYDLIVSNPPYVSLEEWNQLPQEYYAEPKLGFDGGVSGLDCVNRILAQAADHLSDSGVVIVEVGRSAELLQKNYPDCPFLWLDFEHGGDGVFLLTADQLARFQDLSKQSNFVE